LFDLKRVDSKRCFFSAKKNITAPVIATIAKRMPNVPSTKITFLLLVVATVKLIIAAIELETTAINMPLVALIDRLIGLLS